MKRLPASRVFVTTGIRLCSFAIFLQITGLIPVLLRDLSTR